MEHKTKYLIILLSTAVAFLLYFSGIRNIRMRRKNFFYSSLMIALTFIGCNFQESSANGNDNKDDKNIPIGEDDPDYIKALNETKEWKEFKSFWQEIDRIEAAKGVNPESYSGYIEKPGSYSYGSTYEIFDSLSQKALLFDPVLEKLTGKNLLSTLEAKLLGNMLYERISYICYGFQSMMMRMIVSPGLTEKEKTMAQIEFRIDSLLVMKEKGLIDEEEMKLAKQNINSEIKKFSILEIIGERGMYKYYSYEALNNFNKETKSDSLNIADFYLLGFEKSYDEFMKDYKPAKADEQQKLLYDSYINTKSELDVFKKNQEMFCMLVKDLILND